MAKNLVYVGIAVLAAIAVILGYKIYQQQRAYQQVGLTNQSSQPTKQPSGVRASPKASPSPQAQQPSAAEVAKVLKFPGANATEAERKNHSDLVNKLGNQFGGAAFLDISGCNPNPVVYRVKQGGTFKVKNSDQTDHTIYTSIRNTIPANSEKTLESKTIGDNMGAYGYGCDGSSGTVGIIQIVQ